MSEFDHRAFLDRNDPLPAAPVPYWVWGVVHMLGDLLDRLENIMAAQDDINAAVTAVGAVLTDVGVDVATLGADLKAWIAAQPATVDTSALAPLVANAQAVQASLDTQVAAITAAVNPAPAPAPTPAPGS